MIATADAVGFSRPPTFDPFEIDRLDDAELDELPFGVICVDRDGTILRYNIAEARLARLDRANVIGRDFFKTIAPCTATEEFEGRVRRLMRGDVKEPLVRFDYLFDFKFGAQEVIIEAVASADRERFYLLVNRSKFLPAREGLDPAWPAPRQSELVPIEQDAGVERDERGQRVVHTPQLLFEALLRTCVRVAPSTWEIFCREWGVQWGRRAVVDMETRCLEETGQSLRERPMSEVATRVAKQVESEGWGAIRFDLEPSERGAVRIVLDNSALASSSRGAGKRCQLITGMLSSVFTHLAGRRLHAEETRCCAEGHAHCEIVVVGQSRARRLRELADTGHDVDTILQRLGTTHG